MGDHIEIVIPESRLSAQLFLHQVGYLATQVLRDCYGSEDGYLLCGRRPVPSQLPNNSLPTTVMTHRRQTPNGTRASHGDMVGGLTVERWEPFWHVTSGSS
jgi:hypothetical protein